MASLFSYLRIWRYAVIHHAATLLPSTGHNRCEGTRNFLVGHCKLCQPWHSNLALLAARLHRPREDSQSKRPKGIAMKVRVIVTLKNGVLDPQGRAIHHALEGLGFGGVNDVRAGRVIELDVADATSDETLDEMCRKLLANMVIENYRIEKAA